MPRTAPPLPERPVGAGLRGKGPEFVAAGAVGVGLGCEGAAPDVEAVSGGGFAPVCAEGAALDVAAAVLEIEGSSMPCASHS